MEFAKKLISPGCDRTCLAWSHGTLLFSPQLRLHVAKLFFRSAVILLTGERARTNL